MVHPCIFATETRFKNKIKALYLTNFKLKRAFLEKWEIIHDNSNVFTDFLCNNINSTFKLSIFPSTFKLADITPQYVKGRKALKENYGPVKIVPVLSTFF